MQLENSQPRNNFFWRSTPQKVLIHKICYVSLRFETSADRLFWRHEDVHLQLLDGLQFENYLSIV